MASGQWWNIWTLAAAQAEEIVPHTIQASTAPKVGGTYQGNQIYTVNGPYASKAVALQALGQNQGPAPSSQGPSGGIGNPFTGLLGPLFQANIWIRVGEVLLGLVLVAVGLAKITNAVPIATKIAGVAAKGAVLA